MVQPTLTQKTPMKYVVMTVVLASTLALGACGETRGERFLSGAAIGTGVAMTGGAIMGWAPVTTAIIGSSVGGAAGALSEKPWTRPWYDGEYMPWHWWDSRN